MLRLFDATSAAYHVAEYFSKITPSSYASCDQTCKFQDLDLHPASMLFLMRSAYRRHKEARASTARDQVASTLSAVAIDKHTL